MANDSNPGVNHYLRIIIEALGLIITEMVASESRQLEHEKTLKHLGMELGKIMATQAELKAKLDQTLVVVEGEAVGIASINALLAGLRQQVVDALAGNVPDAVMEEVNQVFNTATANAAAINSALTPA